MKLFSLVFTLFISLSAFSKNIEINLTASQNHNINYNFGLTRLGSPNYVRFYLINHETEIIPFAHAYIYGADFSATHNCQAGIPAKGRCTVEIRYWPLFEGFNSGQLEMHFADNNDFRFYLYGEARR